MLGIIRKAVTPGHSFGHCLLHPLAWPLFLSLEGVSGGRVCKELQNHL